MIAAAEIMQAYQKNWPDYRFSASRCVDSDELLIRSTHGDRHCDARLTAQDLSRPLECILDTLDGDFHAFRVLVECPAA